MGDVKAMSASTYCVAEAHARALSCAPSPAERLTGLCLDRLGPTETKGCADDDDSAHCNIFDTPASKHASAKQAAWGQACRRFGASLPFSETIASNCTSQIVKGCHQKSCRG